MSRTDDDVDWSLTSWEGSRRAQLRRWLTLTVRERLQTIEDLAEVAKRVAGLLRPSRRNAVTGIPGVGADADKGVPGEQRGPSEN